METGITTTADHDRPDEDIRLLRPPRSSAAWRVVAGTVLVLAALGMFVIGGCFLVGILEMLRTQYRDTMIPEPHVSSFLNTLYVAAFTSFGIALFLLIVGIWGLLKVLREKPSQP